ncbi:NAD+ synthase (glutamine-hydrolysing) [Geothermobacter ehrlichii]|uniref:Glutamine-dependent NAD(+) synthetase n=1 Tax=Geothermobacter ehrlichii TaxID=213224 RepID=A0A5D3WG61_9BACT|nr:NAD(+) synthase [Geothermobacter ehrlichii]TYO96080.1 NAD+ synthase (glutamine-hydrolysing) [Geothermobacter ehrlichii]
MKELSEKFTDFGLLRLAVGSPELKVADPGFNVEQMIELARRAKERGCQLLLLPELCLTGYSCGDLFYQPALQRAAEVGLLELAGLSRELDLPLVVGLPVAIDGRLYNCAAFLAGGRVCGLVPKTHLPNSAEFYEERWFSAADRLTVAEVVVGGTSVPVGRDLLFAADNHPCCLVGIEICEDLWSVEPPSGRQAAAGAALLLNLSASPEVLGKQGYRRQLVASQSARCLAAYAYASAGPGESSTDLVYAGHSLIAENGQILAETERFLFDSQLAVADIDLARLQLERQRNTSFADADSDDFRVISFSLGRACAESLLRPIPRRPFVPEADRERDERCEEIFAIQTTGLARRLRHTGSRQVVIGVSGGLDSTLALLVAIRAFDRLGLPRSGILAVTMPGFGTTERTRCNAGKLAELLGTTLKVVPIHASVRQHFADIGHDESRHDITYENAQARERTQILMDLANQVGGLVIGTGDLSELALGWATYNGDHMSMYAVNVGVPKTLVRYLVDWCAERVFDGETRAVLHDVSATPVSPELLPPDANGDIGQKTEETVGPYELHDFFLYHAVRLHYPPAKIFAFACQAFAGSYRRDEILRWLRVFFRRFFSQQFKRSCLPDGPKVGSVVLSPRGDWRMPSDASSALWLAELEEIENFGGLASEPF